MLDVKFKDREFLSRCHLDLKLLNNYDFIVSDVIPIRKVFILVTSKGNKVLKKLEYNLEQLNFISNSIEFIRKNGFSQIIQFEKNKNGDIYTDWKSNTYVVMDLINGRECEFNNPIEVAMAARALGKMHLASKGFIYKACCDRNICGNILERYGQKIDELKFFKNLVNSYENKTSFDDIFLGHVNRFIEEGEKSIDILKNSRYCELCEEEDKVAICHHDLAYHNILINNDEVYFIDFDYSVVDLRIHDLCNYIDKVVKGFAYNFQKAKDIIDEYSGISELDKREIEVLYGMLYFPEEFYSISKDYYFKRKLWSEESFIYKLNKKLENFEERGEMLQTFGEYYKL
jgi:CotS family spore coat protein